MVYDSPSASDNEQPKSLEEGTFDRLDSLSGPLAERVMRRAIELQSDADYGAEKVTLVHLEEVASELGVHPDHVRAALQEELAPEINTSVDWLGKILVPKRIAGGTVIRGSREQVESSIVNWMKNEEGFIPTRITGEGYRWKRNDGLAAQLRSGFKHAGGGKGLRSAKWITHRQTEMEDGRQLVELDVDSKMAYYTAIGLGAGFAFLGVIGGIAGVIQGIGSNPLESLLAPLLPSAIFGGGLALVVAKTWGRALRNSLAEALDGFASPQLALHRRTRGRRLMAKAADVLEGSIDELFKGL